MSKIIKAALYIRVSTQEQSEHGYSIDQQLEKLKKYCDLKEWILYKSYIDPGFSGSNIERPAIKELIQDAKEKKFNVVLIYKLDRLSRSQKDTMHLLEDVFLKNNIDLIALNEAFDTTSPFGRAMIGILSVFAQLERENIKERMLLGKLGRVKSGKWAGSNTAPIGYKYIDGVLVIDPYEAEIVKLIFNMYDNNKGVVAIRNHLEKHGYKSHYGPIGKSTIYSILHNNVYIGLNNFQNETYEGSHEAIIDKALFESVQTRFEKNKENPRYSFNMSNFKSKSTFTGLFACPCGCKMRVRYGSKRKDGSRIKYYACVSKTERNIPCSYNNKYVNAEEIERLLLNELYKIEIDNAALYNQPEKKEDNQKQIDTINLRLNDINNQISKLIKLYSIENMDFSIVEKQVQDLSKEKEKLTNALNDLKKDLEKEKPASIDTQAAKEIINDIKSWTIEDIINNSKDAQLNQLLRTLIDRVVATPETMEIHWNF